MRGKWILLSAIVILAAIAAGALSHLRRPAEAPAPASVSAAAVPSQPAEISLSGRIEAQQVVAISAGVGGVIAEFQSDVGQEVYEGQLLARITNQGLETAQESANAAMELAQARVDKAGAAIIAARLEATRARADAVRSRSEFDRAQRTCERQRMLNREGATPRLVYEKAEREYESSQAEYQSLENLARVAENRVTDLIKEQETAKKILDDKSRELEDAKIQLAAAEVHSPVDGLVVDRKGEVGKEIAPSDQEALFRIAVNLSELQVLLSPDPVTARRLKAGDPALVLVADLGGEAIPGTIKEVTEARTLVAFTSPNAGIKPGMTAQVKLKPPSAN
jgi:multidrug resistance efflux pump